MWSIGSFVISSSLGLQAVTSDADTTQIKNGTTKRIQHFAYNKVTKTAMLLAASISYVYTNVC